jgi:hypothetical protein
MGRSLGIGKRIQRKQKGIYIYNIPGVLNLSPEFTCDKRRHLGLQR